MANEQQQVSKPAAQAKSDMVMVEILHGKYVHVAPKWKTDAGGQPVRDHHGNPVSEHAYGHDAAAVAGTASAVVELPKAEADRLVASGTAKLVK